MTRGTSRYHVEVQVGVFPELDDARTVFVSDCGFTIIGLDDHTFVYPAVDGTNNLLELMVTYAMCFVSTTKRKTQWG